MYLNIVISADISECRDLSIDDHLCILRLTGGYQRHMLTISILLSTMHAVLGAGINGISRQSSHL
ncbi:hypothetical protein BJX63DRAFT_410924 [Aspergillus granulosus]|uniref:Uncharacterized protein n=1 Tax=Aspergillus granulosus TaxID=176169 RepID=A0ABR4GY43_9EURO